MYLPNEDEKTKALNTVDYSHHEIHSGSSFTSCHKADVANGANLDILVVTPNTTKWSHLTYELEVEAETDVNIYEAPTASNNGTPLAVFNRDRNSSKTAGTTVFHTPTIAGGSEGTLIRCWHLGSGKTFGGGDRGTHEIILKQNTKYLIRLTNATTGNNYMSVKVDWYEHTNK